MQVHLSSASFPFFCLAESLQVFKPRSLAEIETGLAWKRRVIPPP